MKADNHSSIYWSLLSVDDWKLHLAATPAGLCYIGSQNQSLDEISLWANKKFPGSALVQNDEMLESYKTVLIGYLRGTVDNVDMPLDLRGTPFQLDVWKALCEIPYGQTSSYSDIASRIDKPSAVRAVGTAIGANPVLITVPCHRVIGKNGALTGFRGGLSMKSALLELEQSRSGIDNNTKEHIVHG
ncbi:methylated-DNA--[protein]-cysteine S-methyltransferase [Paenibacillus sp. YIM B09110]|uniref:methylated-DNA--[protein]-cysteine S-methyltransferase n=1 Tax=Paenibacillus sp. YIM B09110 TaxID=3126102 RepID=UPI00301E22D7